MQAPSLAFALGQAKAASAGYQGQGDTSPHSQVATPSRAGATPSRTTAQSPFHSGCGSPAQNLASAAPAFSPIGSPHHADRAVADWHCAEGHSAAAVSVIAPGGGTGINNAVYAELNQDRAFAVDIVGRSRAPYDQYPAYWPNGGPAPNLATFAEDVIRQGWVENSDCFVFGSRGGQVVLPILWERARDQMPPVVCINGGCAMGLPRPIHWPASAVSFLLLGGRDYFRGNASAEQYIAETKSYVPAGNATTAILFVNEMEHMPQAALLRAVLPLMLRAILKWRACPTRPPRDQFRLILERVNSAGWSGRFMYTRGPGEWAPDVDFSPFHVAQHVFTESELAASATPPVPDQEPIQITRKDELKELLRAAVRAAQPSGGVPMASPADKFAAAAQAAGEAARCRRNTAPAQHSHAVKDVAVEEVAKSPSKLKIPPGGLSRPRQPAGAGGGLVLPIPPAGAANGHSPGGSPARHAAERHAGGATPGGASPCPLNRLQVPGQPGLGQPGLGRSLSGHSPAAPTPISRALGMGAHFASLSPSQRSQCSQGSGFSHFSPTHVSPSHLSDLSPARPQVVVVRN